MKTAKIATLAAALAASAMVSAIDTNGIAKLTRDSSEAELRTALSALLTAKDGAEFNSAANALGFWASVTYSKIPNRKAVLAEFDETISSRGFGGMQNWIASWPKVSAIALAAKRTDLIFPSQFSTARRLGCDALPGSIAMKGGTTEDLIDILNERLRHCAETNGSWQTVYATSLMKAIQTAASKSVKRYLRKQGKSFVTKDGVNPCNAKIDELTAALNAPRFAGLNEWLSEMGVERSADLSAIPADSEIAKLKEGVLYGELEFNESRRALLTICLGVDGYNAFVKEFNGDK